MTRRFFAQDIPDAGPVRLIESEAHHLAQVLRITPGEVIELFNGRGRIATGIVDSVSKKHVEIVVSAATETPFPGCRVTIAVAVPKGDRFDWLVEKLTELGVATVIPLRTELGVVDPRGTKLDRLRQITVAACKQSGRAWTLQLCDVADFATVLADVDPTTTVLLDPSGEPWGPIWSTLRTTGPHQLCVLIGPEGGWTDGERAAAIARGVKIAALPTPILRIETAAIAIAAAVLCDPPVS